MKALDHHHNTPTPAKVHHLSVSRTVTRVVAQRDDTVGIGQILDLRVGCWRPPVYVNLPRHLGDA
jgi:hypothetical protein